MTLKFSLRALDHYFGAKEDLQPHDCSAYGLLWTWQQKYYLAVTNVASSDARAVLNNLLFSTLYMAYKVNPKP